MINVEKKNEEILKMKSFSSNYSTINWIFVFFFFSEEWFNFNKCRPFTLRFSTEFNQTHKTKISVIKIQKWLKAEYCMHVRKKHVKIWNSKPNKLKRERKNSAKNDLFVTKLKRLPNNQIELYTDTGKNSDFRYLLVIACSRPICLLFFSFFLCVCYYCYM